MVRNESRSMLLHFSLLLDISSRRSYTCGIKIIQEVLP